MTTYKRVDLLTYTVTDAPFPPELGDLDPTLRVNLNWLGWPQYQNVGWWPNTTAEYTLGEYQRISGYTYAVDIQAQTIVATPIITDWTAEEIEAATVQKIEAFATAAYPQVQGRLDVFARTRNYDSITSACTYALGTDPVFSVEGKRAVQMRDTVYRDLNDKLQLIRNRTLALPSVIEELNLPALTWED
jgi:hypothetical protein